MGFYVPRFVGAGLWDFLALVINMGNVTCFVAASGLSGTPDRCGIFIFLVLLYLVDFLALLPNVGNVPCSVAAGGLSVTGRKRSCCSCCQATLTAPISSGSRGVSASIAENNNDNNSDKRNNNHKNNSNSNINSKKQRRRR